MALFKYRLQNLITNYELVLSFDYAQLPRSRKACGIAALRAQPLVEKYYELS
ncbi:hypothetical protein [Nostoc sp. UHCC 0302]|uniref:hypothetical protein n=1 Tax=Nostoc sp. UHCC 0302 TaxID=3134896 RepID=UPI00311C9AA4